MDKPHFKLQRVYDDGSQDVPEIYKITEIDGQWHMDRRAFFRTSSLATAVLVGLASYPGKIESNTVVTEQSKCGKDLKGHIKAINSVAISPDGKLLVSGSEDKTIKLWEFPKGKLLRTLSEHSGTIESVAISPDGRLIASGSRDKTIKLWKFPEGKLLRTLSEHSGIIESVATSPDGKLLVSGSRDKTIKLWSLPEGKLLRTLSGHTGFINSVVISPDGKLLVSGSEDKTIKLWSLPEGELLRTLSGHTGFINSVVISPDGKLLVSGSEDKTIKLWSLPEGELLRTLSGHTGFINSVVISPDGKLLVSGSEDKTINLWSFPEGEFLTCLVDLAILKSDNSINQFTHVNTSGQTISYTQPCGAPIPNGAICTCNCVSGKMSPPSRRSNSYCTCNKVCTCVPVCQAHHLLDDDPIVQLLAEELLLLMGPSEFEYMSWASRHVKKNLKERIHQMMNLIAEGKLANPTRWPGESQLSPYLDHKDAVTALMSAQMLANYQTLFNISLSNEVRIKVDSWLSKTQHMFWRNHI